jgi:type IV fimbrial biogenesis protein FimT
MLEKIALIYRSERIMNRMLQQSTEKKQQGVTLTEVIVVVAIIGILTSIAVPSYRDTIERNRLKTVAEAVNSDMQFARAQAIKRSQNIVVSMTAGESGTWCYGLDTSACNCADTSCSVKKVLGATFSDKVNMEASPTIDSLEFEFRRGTASGAGIVTFTTTQYTARIELDTVGQVRVCTPTGTVGLPGYPECQSTP